MAICFHGEGEILLKEDKTKEFIDKFIELSKSYDENTNFSCNENNLFKFNNYARHYFMVDLKELLNQNIDSIKCGQIWFSCYDEDCFNDEEGFPFMHFFEMKKGVFYEQTLYKRLSFGWEDGRYEMSEEEINNIKNETFTTSSYESPDGLPF